MVIVVAYENYLYIYIYIYIYVLAALAGWGATRLLAQRELFSRQHDIIYVYIYIYIL